MEDRTMTGALRVACLTAALLAGLALASSPARAQVAPFGGAGGDMMTQMAPMLEVMKAKMGKRRFGQMMQTMGPMMTRMMDSGGFGGMQGGFGGGAGFTPDGFGSGDVMGMLGGNGGEIMSMIPQIMQMAGTGFGGGHGRRYRRRHL
jgi:hypothetical protein